MILLVGYLLSDCGLNYLQYRYMPICTINTFPSLFLIAFFFYRASTGESLACDLAFHLGFNKHCLTNHFVMETKGLLL